MSTDRRGFTIIEFLVVAVLGLILLTAAYQVLITNQRTYTAQSAKIEGRQTTRASLEVLFSELREVNSADLVTLTDDLLTVRAQRNFGLVCNVLTGSTPRFDVVKVGDWFEAGDSVNVFADNEVTNMGDDAWITAYVTAADTTATCSSRKAQQLSFAGQGTRFTADSVRVGAPMRSFVHYDYGLVQSGGDTYMGRVAADGSVEPMIGPLPATVNGEPSVEFLYLDSLGAATTVPGDVAQIELRIRTLSEARGPDGGLIGDSLVSRVYLRN